ncbi:MAG TPA: hypothetical protein VHR45_09085 [Thermoanaerobaculia bacterium]|nr:hypothetical protein [Thermoanaerobaculia bacterium]
MRHECEAYDRISAEMKVLGAYGTLGSLPLVVVLRGLSANPPSALDKASRQAQEALVPLSENSVLVVAERSGHVIPYDEPQVVADAVRRILDAHRTGRPLANR